MKTLAVVSEKGQVTIPQDVRKRLGISPGQVLDFEARDGLLVARKVQVRDGIDEAYGSLDVGMSSDEFMEWVRGPRDDA